MALALLEEEVGTEGPATQPRTEIGDYTTRDIRFDT